MSRSSFSKAYEEITFTINDADLDKLNEILKDINVKECPWFEVQDKHGVKAKYYREPRWIPCSERLPEEDGKYLCCWQGMSVKTGMFLNGHFRLYGEIKDNLVIAWMPLPSPYREEDEE